MLNGGGEVRGQDGCTAIRSPSGNGLEVMGLEWYGSGFVVREDGTILTNFHVASKALSARAQFEMGGSYEIHHIRVYDSVNDLAVLKILADQRFPTVRLGDSDRADAMDQVIAAGNPRNAGLNISQGSITQVVRDYDRQPLVLRHTAAIAPGSSGGPLFKGNHVIGVNVRTWTGTQFHQAVPINLARPLLSPEYDRTLNLQEVFNPSIENLYQKSELIAAENARVDAATTEPALQAWNMTFDDLSDYLIIVTTPDQRDLDLIIKDACGVYAYGATDNPEVEAVAKSNDYAREVSIGVVNYANTRVNFGIEIYKIVW